LIATGSLSAADDSSTPLLWSEYNPGYHFKVEAEGYEPFISRLIESNEESAHFDISLQRGVTPVITVLLPNGEPAAVADVAFAIEGALLKHVSGRLYRKQSEDSPPRQTDSKGQFRFDSDKQVAQIVISHPKGCAVVRPDDLVQTQTIHLQPWGTLEGVYKNPGNSRNGRLFLLTYEFGTVRSMEYAMTDQQGRFIFNKAFPGTHTLQQIVRTPQDNEQPIGLRREVEIKPAQTTKVEMGGGYTVIAKIRLPGGVPKDIEIYGAVHTEFPAAPKNLEDDEEALAEWRSQPEVQEQFRAVKNFLFAPQPDGTWAAEGVEPGEYYVSATAYTPDVYEGEEVQVWAAQGPKISVPSAPATGTIDIGELVLQKRDLGAKNQ